MRGNSGGSIFDKDSSRFGEDFVLENEEVLTLTRRGDGFTDMTWALAQGDGPTALSSGDGGAQNTEGDGPGWGT